MFVTYKNYTELHGQQNTKFNKIAIKKE